MTMLVRAASVDAAAFRCPCVRSGHEAGTRCQHPEPCPGRPVANLLMRSALFSCVFIRRRCGAGRPLHLALPMFRHRSAGPRSGFDAGRPAVAESRALCAVDDSQGICVEDPQTRIVDGRSAYQKEMDRQALSVIPDPGRRVAWSETGFRSDDRIDQSVTDVVLVDLDMNGQDLALPGAWWIRCDHSHAIKPWVSCTVLE